MNGREAVSEFVGESGRQLAQPRQRVLEPQLFFQLDDVRQVGKEADCACSSASLSGDTVTPK